MEGGDDAMYRSEHPVLSFFLAFFCLIKTGRRSISKIFIAWERNGFSMFCVRKLNREINTLTFLLLQDKRCVVYSLECLSSLLALRWVSSATLLILDTVGGQSMVILYSILCFKSLCNSYCDIKRNEFCYNNEIMILEMVQKHWAGNCAKRVLLKKI